MATRLPASLSDSLDSYNGFYLFAHTPPNLGLDEEGNPTTFIKAADDYFSKNDITGSNRGIAWLESVDPVRFGDYSNFGTSFIDPGNGNLVLNKELTINWGTGVKMSLPTGMFLSFDVIRNALYFKLRNPPIPIRITKDNNDIGILLKRNSFNEQELWIPLAGNNAGCITFNASFDPDSAFAGGGLQNGLIYTINLEDPDKPGTYRPTSAYYALFDRTRLSTFDTIGIIDVSDPTNTRVAKTRGFKFC